MANPSRDKGTGFETDVVSYLTEAEFFAERTGSANGGEGDIHFGLTPEMAWTIEAKAEREIDLPGYLRQLGAAVDRRGTAPFKAAAVVKNRRHSTANAYAVMELNRYRQLAMYVSILEGVIGQVSLRDLSNTETLKEALRAAEDGYDVKVFSDWAGQVKAAGIAA